MFSKLAFRNVTRSVGDYAVYFLTITFGVCLFYTFNSIDGQGAMVFLGQKNSPMVEGIRIIINVFSVFVAVVLAGLILYANNFLIRRRKRELGTYFLLGMEPGRVSSVLLLETFLIGLAALVAGLALGAVLSQGLSLLTLSMFQVSMPAFHLTFSLGAAVKTVGYFAVIFLVVILFNNISISRAKLIDLMQGERKNEELKQRPLGVSVALFLVGVVLLLAAYALLLIRGILNIDLIWYGMLAMGTVGTLLIFRSLSGFVLRFTQSHPGLYYRGLNMFTLRQWMSRVHSTYLSMTIICIMLLLAIGITACSIGLNSAIDSQTDESCPYDCTLQDHSEESAAAAPLSDRLTEAGLDLDAVFERWHSLPLYYNDETVTGVKQDAVVARSDYNAVMEMLGQRPLTLTDGVPEVRSEPLGNRFLFNQYAVVPDEVAEQLEIRRTIFTGSYAGDREGAETQFQAACARLAELHPEGTYSSQTWLESYYDLMGSKLIVLFLGLYLGATFLLASAAVLALQQLSQAADNVGRYAILRRLGTPEGMIDRSVFDQVALAFGLPLALAVIHALVGMTSANQIIAEVGKLDVTHSSLVTALLLLAIYGGYFLATVLASRRMAKGNRI